MKPELFKLALEVTEAKSKDQNTPLGAPISGIGVKKVTGRAIPYSDRHRGEWFHPEYISNIHEIQIAQDTDSYLFKSIQKKVNRFMIAGWEFVSNNEEALTYVKRRIKEIETVSGIPFKQLVIQTVGDLARYSNCMWVKVRNNEASTGNIRTNARKKQLEPVAGYFLLPFETLTFKTTISGEIKKVKQKIPPGWTGVAREKEFFPEDVIHFYCNRKPGFSIGTPEILPVLEDLALLRRLEENIEFMIDSNLNPLFHYTVGSDTFPERYGPNGEKESDIVKKTIEYMPAGGIFVSDHRHKIEAIGSEGRALRVEGYLDYFKKRVFAGLGMSGVDFGEGDTSNRSTAQTLSKGAIQDIEALQLHMKSFIENYVIDELLLEGKFDVLDESNKVEIKFGTIDKEEKSKEENQTIQLWANKLITENEARKRLGEKPLSEEERDGTYFKMYEEPLAMLKAIGNVAAGDALAESQTSGITQEGVNRHISIEKSKAETRGRPAAPLLKVQRAHRIINLGQKTNME